MFKLMDEKIFTILSTKLCLSGPVILLKKQQSIIADSNIFLQ